MKNKTARIEKKRKGKLPLDFSPRTKTSLVTSTHRLVITRRVSLERSALACRVSAFIPARTLTPCGGADISRTRCWAKLNFTPFGGRHVCGCTTHPSPRIMTVLVGHVCGTSCLPICFVLSTRGANQSFPARIR